jgi:hypothetical protein
MEIGEKERQIKALRLAREARWKANAKAPIPQSSATLREIIAQVKQRMAPDKPGKKPGMEKPGTERSVGMEAPAGTKASQESFQMKPKRSGGRPPIGLKAMTAKERKARFKQKQRNMELKRDGRK